MVDGITLNADKVTLNTKSLEGIGLTPKGDDTKKLFKKDEQSELMQAIIQYLQQIANNTSNNNTLPAIQSILSGIISNMGSLAQLATSAASSGGNLSDKAAQMKDNIEQELNAMRSKMEALASTP